ncbi:hypothetical protein [Microbacterium maritypicum]
MIPPEAKAILDGDDQPRVLVRKATFVGVVNGFAQCDMGNSRFICEFGSGYIPMVGETVRIWTVGDQHTLFPGAAKPNVGTVLTASSTTASVQTSVGTFICGYAGTAPTSGDRVGIVWSEDGPWCTSKLSNTVPPPAPIPDPGGGGGIRSATFYATDSGSTDRNRSRWWTAQPRAGDSTYGAWFYGTQLPDTIPAAATFVSLEFYVSWQQRSGSAPNFALHNYGSKNGLPSFGSSAAWAPAGSWQTPPGAAGWFAALKAGGGFLGVGLNQGGNNIFSSLAQDAMSGALRISWRS